MEEWLTMDITENGAQICDDLNRVELSGTIVEIIDKNYAIRVTLGINISYKSNLYSNYPYIFFFKSHGVSLDDFRLHDKVDILAAAVSKKITREDGTTCKRQELRGVAIRKAGEMYEPRRKYFCSADKKYYFIGHNKIYLEGILTCTYKVGDGIYRYLISNLSDNNVNQIHFLHYTENEPDIPYGTRVAIDAVIQTRMRESGGYKHHFQDFIICSVRVLD